MNHTLAASLILYHPDVNVVENIESYIHLVKKLFIVDNSEECDENIIQSIKIKFPNYTIEFIINHQNEGLSVPLNQVFSRSEQQEFDFVITMDQDSKFINPSVLNEAMTILQNDETIGLIGMAHYKTGMKTWYQGNRNFIFAKDVITSGSITRISAWKKIGGFDERFFIDEVDNDFCMALKVNGYKILQSKCKVIQHQLGESVLMPHRFSEKTKEVALHNPLRSYYITRNNLLFLKKYSLHNPWYVFRKLKYYFLRIKKHYLYAPDFNEHKRFIKKGVKDFFKKKFGKLEN